ncbi:mucin-like glycoprotein, partial [Trypanosoma conorhini]
MLLPPRSPLALLRRMAMAMTVRRRAVCALALLALLCGSVCVTAAAASAEEEVDVSVEVSCADSEQKLSWRLPGEAAWQKCAITVKDSFSMSGAIGEAENSLCAWAGTQYTSSSFDKSRICPESTAGSTAAFTMKCRAKKSSGVYKRWQSVSKTPGASHVAVSGDEPLGVLHTCTMQPSSGGAAGED